MSVKDPLNRHQKAFLRNMRKDPDGLPQDQWPEAVVLRRWLRKPRFKAALKSLRETFAAEIDVMLAGAAARAAKRLQALLAGESGGVDQEQRIQALVRVIRTAHLRAKESPRRRTRTARTPTDARSMRAPSAAPFSGPARGARRAAADAIGTVACEPPGDSARKTGPFEDPGPVPASAREPLSDSARGARLVTDSRLATADNPWIGPAHEARPAEDSVPMRGTAGEPLTQRRSA